MIHRKREGLPSKMGINWNIDKHTKLYLSFRFPIKFIPTHQYKEFDTGDLVSSALLEVYNIGFRINSRWKFFWRCNRYPCVYGLKQLIKTEEELDFENNKLDRLLQLLTDYDYGYDYKHEIYYNYAEKKIFSVEFLFQEPIAKILFAFRTPVDKPTFFFVTTPSYYVKETIWKELKEWNPTGL